MAYSPNYISQQDPVWKNIKLGFSNFTIGSDGCTLSCLTMLVNGFGHNETPATMNKKLKGLGDGNGFVGGLIAWGGLTSLFPEFNLQKIIACRKDTQNAPLAEIDAALSQGQVVLVELDQSPAPGIQNHWVVLYKKEGDDYLMNDPWPYPVDGQPTLLTPRYAAGRTLKKVITAVVWYVKKRSTPPLEDGMYVQVSQSASRGLRLRAQPTTASSILAVEAAGAYLRVLEEEAGAAAKIGVTGEWLHVRDEIDTEGYVAAWYVDAVPGTGTGTGTDTDDDTTDTGTDTDTDTDTGIDTDTDTETDTGTDDGTDTDTETDTDADTGTDTDTSSDTDTLKVYVPLSFGDRGLRMRSQPSLGGSLIAVLSASTELTVLEDADSAQAKLGVNNAWLHVKDGAQHEGYVAAWLVTLNLDEAPADDSGEEPNDEPTEEPGDTPNNPPVDTSDDDTTPGLKVYVLQNVSSRGLRMRAKPSLDGSLVTTLSQTTELTSLEDADTTHTKVGINGKWLHVKDGAQHEGYVAAWLITFDLDEEPADEPVDNPTDQPVDEPDTPTTQESVPLSVTVFPSLGRNGLRMRAEPNLRGELVRVLAGGAQLTVLDDPTFAASKVGVYGQWLHVRAPTGRDGYVAAWYVKLDESTVHQPPPSTLIVYVTPLARGGLRMRQGPSTGYGIVKTLKANSALIVLENEEEAIAKIGATGEWLHVRDENQTEGYVAAWYIVR